MRWLLIIFLLFLGLSQFECRESTLKDKVESPVLASGKDWIITEADFLNELKNRDALGASESKKREILHSMVLFKASCEKAKNHGLMERPDVTEARDRAMVHLLYEETLVPKLDAVTVTEKEIMTYYESHRDEFTVPLKIRVAVIWIDKSTSGSRQKIELARKESLNLASNEFGFGELAQLYSDDLPSKQRNGDIGWIGLGNSKWPQRFPETMADTLWSLKEGEISQVLEFPLGYALCKVINIRNSALMPLSEVKEKIRLKIVKEQKSQLKIQFESEILKDSSANINGHTLESFLKGQGPQQPKKPPQLPQ